MGFDIEEMVKSKEALRRKLAERPISEKLRLAEELSERALAIRPDDSPSPPNAPWPIPSHWRWKKMGQIATVGGGSTPPTDHDEYFGGDIPWITPADLSKYTAKTISRGARNITQAGLDNSGARLLPAGTVLFSSRAPIGYVAIAENPVATNQGFKSFILKDEVRPDFVYYYLQRARDLARSLASGTTFLEISGKKAAQIPIPVPPLDEQERIVAEIEKQFTRLDAGVALLKRMQIALKRYRGSVLKAACEGRLVPTEAELARKENRSYETGECLLQRILEQRRDKWKGAGKYKEPVTPSIADLQSLPEGWTWCMSDAVFVFVTSGSRGWAKYYSAAGSIFLRIGNLNHEDIHLDLRDIQHVRPPKGSEGTRTVVEPNDILVSITADVGMVALVPEKLGEAYINQHVALARSVDSICAKYIAYYFCSSEGGWKHMKKLQRGATKVGLGLDDIRSVPIPLPPVAEQQRIVAEVERQLSVIEGLAAVIGTSVQRAERLRQSILMQAFSGRFPASQLRSTYAA
jgi:type I restriction enzyme, S subunit